LVERTVYRKGHPQRLEYGT